MPTQTDIIYSLKEIQFAKYHKLFYHIFILLLTVFLQPEKLKF